MKNVRNIVNVIIVMMICFVGFGQDQEYDRLVIKYTTESDKEIVRFDIEETENNNEYNIVNCLSPLNTRTGL